MKENHIKLFINKVKNNNKLRIWIQLIYLQKCFKLYVDINL